MRSLGLFVFVVVVILAVGVVEGRGGGRGGGGRGGGGRSGGRWVQFIFALFIFFFLMTNNDQPWPTEGEEEEGEAGHPLEGEVEAGIQVDDHHRSPTKIIWWATN